MREKPPLLSTLLPSHSWANQRVFIIAGGPSIKDIPSEWLQIIQQERTIGCNKAFTEYSCDINLVLDRGLYQELYFPKLEEQKELYLRFQAYEGIKAFIDYGAKGNWIEDPLLYRVKRLVKRQISLDPGKVFCGNNCAHTAMMLAVALGASEIYLLGCDMECTDGNTHWHKGYKGQSKEALDNKFPKFIECFDQTAPLLKEIGTKIYDCSPYGGLQCFPKIKLIPPKVKNDVNDLY